jgi:KDO2-lipid IV(A) lauroyltransferase
MLIETVRLPQAQEKEVLDRCEFHGVEHLQAAAAKGKGVLVLAGHIGSWELALAAAALRGYPVHIIFKEIKGAVGQYAVDRIRGTHGVCGIPRRNSIFPILRLLRQNAFVGFVLDQNVTADEGVFVEFFGRPACTLPGLAILAQRHGTPVVPVHFYRDPDLRRHHVVFLPEIPWEEAGPDLAANIRHNTQRYTRLLEGVIRARPDQWLWLHRRWKTRPVSPAA